MDLLGLGDAALGFGDLVDQGAFEQLDGHAVVSVALGHLVELGDTGGEGVASGATAQQLGFTVLAGGQPGAQFAADLGEGARRGRPGDRLE